MEAGGPPGDRQSRGSFLHDLPWYAIFAGVAFGQASLGILGLLVRTVLRAAGERVPLRRRFLGLKPGGIELAVLGLALAAGVAAVWSPKRGVAVLTGEIYLLLALLAIRAGKELVQHESFLFRRLMPVMAIGTAISAGLVLYGRLEMGVSRPGTLFIGPNGTGTLLIMAGIMCIGWADTVLRDRWKTLLFWIGFVTLVAAGLAMTLSRGGWLGFGAGLAFYALRSVRTLTYLLVIVAVLALILGSSGGLKGEFLRRIQEIPTDNRIDVWKTTLNMVKAYPVVGVGAGVFPYVYERYMVEGAPPGITFAHNIFLNVLAEMGVIGLAAFLVLMFVTGRAAMRLRNTGVAFHRALVAAFLGVMVHQQVDIPILMVDVGFLFWLIVGMITAYSSALAGTARAAETGDTSA